MIKKITLCFFTVASFGVYAQEFVHQVLVLNEGHNDFSTGQQLVPVSIGKYDPVAATYSQVLTIPNARFGSDILVNDQAIFVAADSFLLKYDRDSFQLLDQEVIVGIREFAEWNGSLVITRGEVGGLSHYAEVRNMSDLSLDYIISIADGLQWSCESVVVEDDIAYIGVNNAFDWGNFVGKIGMVDLVAKTYMGAADLGTNALNPDNLMMGNGKLYTLNNKDFTGSSITEFDLATLTTGATQDISTTSGCGASLIVDDQIYFQEFDLAMVSRYDVNAQTIIDTLPGTLSYYGMGNDEINQLLYATITDFVSTGEIHILAYDGTTMSTIPAGVAGGSFAFDIRTANSVEEFSSEPLSFYVDGAEIVLSGTTGAVELFDARGALVSSLDMNGRNNRFSIADLTAGAYVIRQNGRSGRFIK